MCWHAPTSASHVYTHGSAAGHHEGTTLQRSHATNAKLLRVWLVLRDAANRMWVGDEYYSHVYQRIPDRGASCVGAWSALGRALTF